MELLFAMLFGFTLDLVFGDPNWLPHPIRFIGFMISKGEIIARRLINKNKFLSGLILSITVIIISFLIPFFIINLSSKINIYLKIFIESIFIYQIMATKSLRKESMKVYTYLKKGDIANSRKYVSYIVGRDTNNLNEIEITKAAIETVAENTSDGIIAPLFYIAIGGAPLGFLYKAVNTLDSMIGYKNDKYKDFGKFAAKLDDSFNYIPAIIASYIMIVSSFILRLNYRNAFKIYKRDRYNSSSPNSGKTESVAAGAMEIQLLGDAYYFGKLVKKKTIGDNIRKVCIEDIKKVNNLMYCTSILGLIIFMTIRSIIL